MNIIIAGDFAPQGRVATLISNEKYEKVFGEVKPLIVDADYSIVNLEAPITESTLCQPIVKAGPTLHTSTHASEAIKWAGFKGVTLANNHLRDYGDNGVSDTLFYLTHNGLTTFGGGLDLQEASQTRYIEVGGVIFAVVNC